MSRVRSTSRTVAVAALGATLALAISGFVPSGKADAQRPDRLDRCQRTVHTCQVQLEHVQADLAYYQAAYQELVTGLDRIETANRRGGARSQRQIQALVDRTRASAARYVQPAGQVVQVDRPRRGGPQYAPAPMSDRAFRNLLASVEQASFDQNRLELITLAARDNLFVANQVVALMQACAFEQTRLEVAATLYPRLVDTRDAHRIFDALTFASSRTALRQRISP
jgi:hypothetical protein